MAYWTRKEFAIRSKTLTNTLSKEMNRMTETQLSEQDVTASQSTSLHTTDTSASDCTPSLAAEELKLMHSARRRGCVVVSPLGMKDYLTECEIAHLP